MVQCKQDDAKSGGVAANVWLLDTGDDGVLGIGRCHRGEKLLALFSFADSERRVALNEWGDYRDLLSGEEVDKRSATLPGGGFAWLLGDFGEDDT